MKAILMTLVAAGAALSLTPASAQWGGPSPYRNPYGGPYSRPAGGCASGHCSEGGCSTGACADRCGCDAGLCETGRCGPDCDMTLCGGGCADGNCGRPGVRPLPRRPVTDPAPSLGYRPGGYRPSPFMAGRAARSNW